MSDPKFRGWEINKVESGSIEKLNDFDLGELNKLLPWKCFTTDLKGRRFGNHARPGKRDTPQLIPDPRIERLNSIFDLREKTVLEIGCFEGIHTIGLAKYAKHVQAVDSRIENVVKTIVRTKLFGVRADVDLVDVESVDQLDQCLAADIIHHVGVLYHLVDPVMHLVHLLERSVGRSTRGILLDTHYADKHAKLETYETEVGKFQYFNYQEGGRSDVFSGMSSQSKWLRREDILGLLDRAGFVNQVIENDSQQRNGPRFTVYAWRS